MPNAAIPAWAKFRTTVSVAGLPDDIEYHADMLAVRVALDGEMVLLPRSKVCELLRHGPHKVGEANACEFQNIRVEVERVAL